MSDRKLHLWRPAKGAASTESIGSVQIHLPCISGIFLNKKERKLMHKIHFSWRKFWLLCMHLPAQSSVMMASKSTLNPSADRTGLTRTTRRSIDKFSDRSNNNNINSLMEKWTHYPAQSDMVWNTNSPATALSWVQDQWMCYYRLATQKSSRQSDCIVK
jgi:hypothetical protein